MSFLLVLGGVHLVALAVPGPDFFLVSRTAISASRRAALITAAGVVLGNMIWAALALLGLHLLFAQIAWLQSLIKAAGGAYLIYLGVLMFRASLPSTRADEPALPTKSSKAFRSGLLTNLANPKAAIYFGSIFATFLTPATNPLAKFVMFTLVSVESMLWFSLVGMLFCLPAPRRFYQRAQKWIDRVAGTVFAAFGLRLLWMSRS